ncbi:MAG: MarR family transcriptional regulator [Clostridia bacterium]|nr:MarR family transcriptional regulator [Clostridia bacterium]
MLDLTTSQLRCLLTVMDLSSPGNSVASKEIAVQMRVSRPSVHRLLEGLARRGLIDKEPYGAVEMSEKGRREGEKLMSLEKACAERMAGQFGLSASEAEKAALVLICELDEESIALIAGK